jgi:hypothetical protein
VKHYLALTEQQTILGRVDNRSMDLNLTETAFLSLIALLGLQRTPPGPLQWLIRVRPVGKAEPAATSPSETS